MNMPIPIAIPPTTRAAIAKVSQSTRTLAHIAAESRRERYDIKDSFLDADRGAAGSGWEMYDMEYSFSELDRSRLPLRTIVLKQPLLILLATVLLPTTCRYIPIIDSHGRLEYQEIPATFPHSVREFPESQKNSGMSSTLRTTIRCGRGIDV
jgi:hypothetical protein